MSHDPDPTRLNLAMHAVGELCLELAQRGCRPEEIATAMAVMLGVATAAIDCCPEHAAEAEDVVVEIFEDSLSEHRARFAAFERVGAAGMHHQEGNA